MNAFSLSLAHMGNSSASNTKAFMFDRHTDGHILCFKNSCPDSARLLSPTIFETQKSLSLRSAHGQHFLKHESLLSLKRLS